MTKNMTGWAIERYINSELHYWGGKGADHFTPHHEEAVRFVRGVDANIVLAWLCDGNGRVAQHVWVSRPAEMMIGS